jgi:hypothetical protein
MPGTDEFDPKFSIQIEDIKELKKLGGLGWKTKLVVGGLLGMEVIDGLTLETPQGTTTLTALPRRDELFNRLIALSQNVGSFAFVSHNLHADSLTSLLQRWDSY